MEEPIICFHCGTKLIRTTWGNLFCPNCGKINGKEESDEKEGLITLARENPLVDYLGLDDDWRNLPKDEKVRLGLYKPSRNRLKAHGRRLLVKVVSLIVLTAIVYFSFKFISWRWGV